MTSSYVAAHAEDLIALVPTVLRFEPQDSVVVMTFGPTGRSFHARVDLPRRPREQDDVAQVILNAIRTNRARECAILIYSPDRATAAAQGRKLNRTLRRAGVRVVEVLRVDAGRYFRILQADAVGTAFDIAAHPFTPKRIVDGVVVHKSREDLAATLNPSDEDRELQAEVRQEAAQRLSQERDSAAEAQWIRASVEEALGSGRVAGADLPRLLADLTDSELADVAWSMIDRSRAEAHIELWRDALRRAPEEFADGPACLLAFAAWLAGDGALAWCGLDRCHEQTLPMVTMLTSLLHSAVPPSRWPEFSAEELSAMRRPA